MTDPMPASDSSTLRFAIVGCGVIGQHHARSITRSDGADLTVTVDPVQTSARSLAADHDATPVFALEDALVRGDVDAVAICTPSGCHADLAVQALQAGKHVVVEKPVDVSADAATRLSEAAAASDRTVTVISQHRFDAASVVVHDAVQQGRFGTITTGVASVAWWRSQSYYDSGDWRGTWSLDGGGVLMNQAIHTIDLLIWMLGRPVEVTALAACLAHENIEVEDSAVAIVRFASGALGVVHGTTAAYPGLSACVQVHGSRGSAIIDDDALRYFHAAPADGHAEAPSYGAGLSSNQASLVLPDGDPVAPAAGADATALSNAHDLQYEDFIDAVRTRRAPRVTVAGATTTLQVILAIYQSAREHRPVPVPCAMMGP